MNDNWNKILTQSQQKEINYQSTANHINIVRFVKKSSQRAETPFLILLKPFLIYLDTWPNKTDLLMNTISKMIKKPG